MSAIKTAIQVLSTTNGINELSCISLSTISKLLNSIETKDDLADYTEYLKLWHSKCLRLKPSSAEKICRKLSKFPNELLQIVREPNNYNIYLRDDRAQHLLKGFESEQIEDPESTILEIIGLSLVEEGRPNQKVLGSAVGLIEAKAVDHLLEPTLNDLADVWEAPNVNSDDSTVQMGFLYDYEHIKSRLQGALPKASELHQKFIKHAVEDIEKGLSTIKL